MKIVGRLICLGMMAVFVLGCLLPIANTQASNGDNKNILDGNVLMIATGNAGRTYTPSVMIFPAGTTSFSMYIACEYSSVKEIRLNVATTTRMAMWTNNGSTTNPTQWTEFEISHSGEYNYSYVFSGFSDGDFFRLSVNDGRGTGDGVCDYANVNWIGAGNEYYIKIRDAPATTPPVVTMVYPQGGELFDVGEIVVVGWSVLSGTNPFYVFINYTTDGQTYYPIAGEQPFAQETTGDGMQSWTIPNEPTENGAVNIDVVGVGKDTVVSSAFSIVVEPTLEAYVGFEGMEESGNYSTGDDINITMNGTGVALGEAFSISVLWQPFFWIEGEGFCQLAEENVSDALIMNGGTEWYAFVNYTVPDIFDVSYVVPFYETNPLIGETSALCVLQVEVQIQEPMLIMVETIYCNGMPSNEINRGEFISGSSGNFTILAEAVLPPETTEENGITITFTQVGSWVVGDTEGVRETVGVEMPVKVRVRSDVGIDAVTLSYEGVDGHSHDVEMQKSSGTIYNGIWSGEISAQSASGVVYYSVSAMDDEGNETSTKQSYVVIIEPIVPSTQTPVGAFFLGYTFEQTMGAIVVIGSILGILLLFSRGLLTLGAGIIGVFIMGIGMVFFLFV